MILRLGEAHTNCVYKLYIEPLWFVIHRGLHQIGAGHHMVSRPNSVTHRKRTPKSK
jgi:hypothetical protein